MPIHVERYLNEEKVVTYMGREFLVPKATVWMAMEPYADSGSQMLVSFTSEEEPLLSTGVSWRKNGKVRVVAIVHVFCEDIPIEKSLVKVG